MLDQLFKDFRYSIRLLSKLPVFSITAILSIALGIGANAVVFSAISALLLKSLPYNEPERIVLIWGINHDNGSLSLRDQISATDIADLRTQNSVFEDVTTFTGWMPILSGYGAAERVPAIQVGDGYFKIMKAKPFLGRVFLPEEQQEGKDFVVILSYGLWQSHFGKDPKIIGKRVFFNARPYTIVGVMPREFRPLPLSLVAPEGAFYRPVAEAIGEPQRDERHLRAIARLRPNVTLQQAAAQTDLIGKQLASAHPETNHDRGFHVVSLNEDTVGKLRPALLILFAVVAFVLSIACANVANLLLVRATVRTKELTIRRALGAGRGRIMQQLLTESLVLSLLGGTIGLLLAYWGIDSVQLLAFKINPLLGEIHLDIRVLLFVCGISLATGIAFGFAPAFLAANYELTEGLKEGSVRSTGGGGSKRLRNLLVIGEIAMAMMLLLCAGLLVQTMSQLGKINVGFEAESILTMNLAVPGIKYPKDENVRLFFDQVMDRVKILPGVKSAGITSVLPLSGNFDGRGIEIEGRPVQKGFEQSADMYVVSPGYLEAMQIPVLRGRSIAALDKADSQQVALINESMAKQLWPKQDPIGKRIRLAMGEKETPWRTIAGIVTDVSQYALEQKAPLQFYVPFDQFPTRFNNVVVKTYGDPYAMLQSVKREILTVDKDQAVFNVVTMQELLADSIVLKRFLTVILVAFSFLALVLAAVGFYGVMSYAVTQRKKEIGIRMALGASRGQIGKMIFGEAMKLTLTGVFLGALGAILLTRLLVTLLYNVNPANLEDLLSVSALLIMIPLVSCLAPAVRAMNVPPAISLRYE